MTRRKSATRAALFTNNAEAFGTSPELIFLMESKGLWQQIEHEVKKVNKDFNSSTELNFPIDQLVENLEALKLLVALRRG